LPGRDHTLTPPTDTVLTALIRRDRQIVLAALFVLALVAWGYVLWLAGQMNAPAMPGMDMRMDSSMGMDMSGMMMPQLAAWTFAHALFIFAMWAVMMVGMMTPSVAPMVLLYAQVARQAGTGSKIFAPAGYFASGYLLAWVVFAAAATTAQYGLERLALLSPMMASTSKIFGGAVLIGAGLYQLSPAKNACLAQCRAPLSFVQRHGGFKPEASGSLRLGLLHGAYCIGCCWALMTLLFVVGVMNVLWIAILSIAILIEKILPAGRYLATVTAVASLGLGIWTIAF
jgi:predicted metal-binding membrane protein